MRVKDCWDVELGEGTVTMELGKKKSTGIFFSSAGSNTLQRVSECFPFIEIIFFIGFSAD